MHNNNNNHFKNIYQSINMHVNEKNSIKILDRHVLFTFFFYIIVSTK